MSDMCFDDFDYERDDEEQERREADEAAAERIALDDMLNVSTSDNKYTIIQDHTGRVRALRYGEEWDRDLVGDGMVLALAYSLADLQNKISKLRAFFDSVTAVTFLNVSQFTALAENVVGYVSEDCIQTASLSLIDTAKSNNRKLFAETVAITKELGLAPELLSSTQDSGGNNIDQQTQSSVVFEMDSIEHYSDHECCNNFGKQCECGGFMHYQPVHGGVYYKCEKCLKEECN